jgi:hypothetical protein
LCVGMLLYGVVEIANRRHDPNNPKLNTKL